MGRVSGARGAETGRLLARLDEVKARPFQRGDFRQRDPAGRINEVVLLDEWLVTYWTDHAVQEIRLVALDRADPPTTKMSPNAATTAGNPGPPLSANPASAPKSIPQKTCRPTLDLRRPAAQAR